jgi:hypothetical protein
MILGFLLVLIGVQAWNMPGNIGSFMLRSFVGQFEDVFAWKHTNIFIFLIDLGRLN